MEDGQYFVQIKDPLEIRRTLLGNSRQTIQILQRYERIKDLRVKKLEKISKLRGTNREVNLLVAKMKKAFPAADLRIRLDKETKPSKERKSEVKGDELAKLEHELRRIEEKIGKIR